MGNRHWRLHGTKPIETGRCAFRVRNGEMRLVDTWFGRDELILPEHRPQGLCQTLASGVRGDSRKRHGH